MKIYKAIHDYSMENGDIAFVKGKQYIGANNDDMMPEEAGTVGAALTSVEIMEPFDTNFVAIYNNNKVPHFLPQKYVDQYFIIKETYKGLKCLVSMIVDDHLIFVKGVVYSLSVFNSAPSLFTITR